MKEVIFTKKEEQKKEEGVTFILPECCRESWETCPHIPKKQRKEKYNIAL